MDGNKEKRRDKITKNIKVTGIQSASNAGVGGPQCSVTRNVLPGNSWEVNKRTSGKRETRRGMSPNKHKTVIKNKTTTTSNEMDALKQEFNWNATALSRGPRHGIQITHR
jgi:hypothetical protein